MPDMTTEAPIKLYRPSNGTEGDGFHSTWCGNCKRDKVWNGEVHANQAHESDFCQILGATLLFDIEDPEYPPEWRYNDEGRPVCTAFIHVDDSFRDIRDPLTVDMFGG